jgi:hypothetical protein
MALRKRKKQLKGCVWLLYTFTIEGSYAQDIERPATRVPDTFQYWITPSCAFDVRTFAIDQDIRVLRLEHEGHVDDPVAYFQEVAQETYGDIIQAHYRIEATGDESVESLRKKVCALGLHPHVEMTELGFPLWLPEDAKYYTKHEEEDIDDDDGRAA